MRHETENPPATADEHVGNWYVIFWGLPAPEGREFMVASGLTIRPLSDRISVFDLAAAGAKGFREWAVLEPFASGLLSEVESASDSDTAGYDVLNRIWLLSALLCVRGIRRQVGIAASSYTWNEVAGIAGGIGREPSGRILEPFRGSLLDYHVKMLLPANAGRALTDGDLDWLAKHYHVANHLAHTSEAFQFALEAAADWRFQPEARAAVSRIWAGVEALFGLSAELSFRISAYAATALCPNAGEERLEAFRRVSRLYRVRSRAVHGDKVAADALLSALEESADLLDSLLRIAIEGGGFPSAEELNSRLLRGRA